MAAVKFRGPLFTDPGAAIRKGAHPGLTRLGAQIEATVRLHTPTRTGSYMRSYETVVWQGNRGVSVKSNDRRTRKTWLERGTRRGVKLARANRMWSKGKSKAREINKQALLAADIAKALND
jgi:hypothetical protein